MDLKDKRVVVTGASSGIGWQLTKRLVKAGAQVIGVSRHPERVRKIGAVPIKCDVTDPEQIDKMLEEAEIKLGGIDIFVANAGFGYYGKLGPANWQKIEKIFRTNFMAPVYTLQKLTEKERTEPLTYMITVSALGKMVLPGFCLYDATKFALDGFVRTYRMEKPKYLTIIPVYPVSSRTNFWYNTTESGEPTPMPIMAQQPASVTAWFMEKALRHGWYAVHPSLVFNVRNLLVRVLPVDLIPQTVEKIRFKYWLKKQGDSLD